MKGIKTIIFILSIMVITLIIILFNLKDKDRVTYTLAEVESTVSNEVSGIYSTEDSLIELSGKDIRIIDILNKKVFTIVLNESIDKKKTFETKLSKLKKALKAEYNLDEEFSYQYFIENLAIVIKPNAEVIILRLNKIKGIERLSASLTSTTLIPNIDQAIRNYNEANIRYPELRKYLTTRFDVVVIDDNNMKFHVFSPTGIITVGMQGELPPDLPELTITEMLSTSKDLDLGMLLRSKHDNFSFQFTCNIGNYILSFDTIGQQYLYNTTKDSYEFITTIN